MARRDISFHATGLLQLLEAVQAGQHSEGGDGSLGALSKTTIGIDSPSRQDRISKLVNLKKNYS